MSRAADLAAGRAVDHEPAFAAYLEGRTVAVVGPGPLADGDLEDIAAHDLTYQVGDHRAHDLPADIQFANRIAIRTHLRGTTINPGVTWTVTKSATHNLPNTRKARYPANINLNQVPIALWDLTNFMPADVSVYGADLYLAGPGRVYTDRYSTSPAHKHYNGIISHQPTVQHEHCRTIRDRTGWFTRSPRFAAILDMDTADYWEQLRAVWVPAVHGVAA